MASQRLARIANQTDVLRVEWQALMSIDPFGDLFWDPNIHLHAGDSLPTTGKPPTCWRKNLLTMPAEMLEYKRLASAGIESRNC